MILSSRYCSQVFRVFKRVMYHMDETIGAMGTACIPTSARQVPGTPLISSQEKQEATFLLVLLGYITPVQKILGVKSSNKIISIGSGEWALHVRHTEFGQIH